MTLLRLSSLALILGATALAIVQTCSAELPRWKKGVFITLRIIGGTLIVLAFVEPSFTVIRLPERNRPIPVLIDASRSMSLFSVDSVVQRFRQTLEMIDRGPSADRRALPWFLFGDSLRRCDDLSTVPSNDRRSFLPSMNSDHVLQKATELIVISDAHWSNSASIASDLGGRAVWYLPLAMTRLPPTIAASLPDTVTAASGKSRSTKIPCSGRASGATTVTLTLTEDTVTLFADSITVGPGPFAHTFEARLPAASAGLHLYRVHVANRLDAVRQSGCMVHHAVPQAFMYTIISSRQSLDIRFFRLALARSSLLVEAAPSAKHRDVVFIFGEGRSNEPVLPSNALPVYFGCLPGKTVRVDSVAVARPLLPDCGVTNPFFQLPLRDLPPIAFMVRNRQIVSACPWLSAEVGNDTIPLLFSGIHRDRPIVACAFCGFWKWDFLPLSHSSGEAETFAFSHRLVDAITERLHTMRTDTLLVFPSGQPTAIDSLQLSCSIPQSAHVSEPIRLPCSIRNTNSTFRYDTLLEFTPSGPLLRKVALPPLDSGWYSVRCSLSTAIKTMHSDIPFHVAADNSELLVSAQNETILREIGRPLDITSTDQLADLLRPSEGNPMDQTVSKNIVIKRSWGILIALLLLLGVEWLMRRFAELE